MEESRNRLTPRSVDACEASDKAPAASHTPGPWHYIASNKHHGPYVAADVGGDICDCYTMSNLSAASVRNGGDSYPIHFHAERADANARLIAAAPDLLSSLIDLYALVSSKHCVVPNDQYLKVARAAAVIEEATEQPKRRARGKEAREATPVGEANLNPTLSKAGA